MTAQYRPLNSPAASRTQFIQESYLSSVRLTMSHFANTVSPYAERFTTSLHEHSSPSPTIWSPVILVIGEVDVAEAASK
eukprot:9240737-Pyramimonas_sp.AAC.1